MQQLRRNRFLASSLGAAGVAIFPRGARAAEFDWKYGINLGADDPIVVRAVEAFSRIKRDTGGRIDIRAFPNSALGGDPAMLSQLRTGALELFGSTGSGLDTVVPVASICGIGFAFKDAANACDAFDGAVGQLVRNDVAAKGMYAFDHPFNPGFVNLNMATKPIRTPEDLAGVRIRVQPSKQNVELIRAMGGSANAIAAAEVYTALQTHIVDGIDASITGIVSIGWSAAVKYVTLSAHRWNCYWTLANADKWKALPKTLQDTVAKHLDASVQAQRKDWAVHQRSFIDKLTRSGIVFNTPDRTAFKTKLRNENYYARCREDYGQAAWATLAKYTDIG